MRDELIQTKGSGPLVLGDVLGQIQNAVLHRVQKFLCHPSWCEHDLTWLKFSCIGNPARRIQSIAVGADMPDGPERLSGEEPARGLHAEAAEAEVSSSSFLERQDRAKIIGHR